ncbi:hypothetical protein L580_2859 [Serratia fonticola AU-P3(3)]|nr:hypothetical protein L580_2859 [Serratia fonticola AU-P3(3)]
MQLFEFRKLSLKAGRQSTQVQILRIVHMRSVLEREGYEVAAECHNLSEETSKNWMQ